MKKFLIAAAASLLIFGGQNAVEAADAENLKVQGVEVQQVGWWAHFRDKHILGRETENERRDRQEWERNHRYPPPPPNNYGSHHPRHEPPPPHRR